MEKCDKTNSDAEKQNCGVKREFLEPKPEDNVIDEQICLVNKLLPNELLVKIFKRLDFEERIGVERVCPKWRLLAKGLAWTDVHSFKMETLTINELYTTNEREMNKIQEKGNLYKAIFLRCGKYLKSVTLHQPKRCYGIDHVKLFPLLKELQHLEVVNQSPGSGHFPKLIGNIAQSFPNLRSLAFVHGCDKNVFIELKKVFSECKSLEYFHDGFWLRDDSARNFMEFSPPTLKIVSAKRPLPELVRCRYLSWLDGMNLSALIYSWLSGNDIVAHKALFSRLKFLQVSEFVGEFEPLQLSFIELAHLQALQICDKITDKDVRMLLPKLRDLEHLHLPVHNYNQKWQLSSLKKLRSFSATLGCYISLPNARNVLISALKGCVKLEHLEVGPVLELEEAELCQFVRGPVLELEEAELCQIVRHCPSLKTIVCGFERSEVDYCFDQFRKVLDELHANEIAPSALDDSRILHIHLYPKNGVTRPDWVHPWARVHFPGKVPPPKSKVLLKLIGQCCTSEPLPGILMEKLNLNEDRIYV